MDLVFEHVFKSYGEKQVLCDFSHRFSHGKIHCIMGASGCGKTTLLRLAAGLESADAGTVLLPGQIKISAVFQEDRLIENLTVEKNVLLTARRGFTRADARALLTEVELGAWAERRIDCLSGGMKRRVALARALAVNFDLLLLDEPFSGLDEHARRCALNAILRRSENRTLLCVTHDSGVAEFLNAQTLRL